VSKLRLQSTANFRLTAIYLTLFTLSTLAVDSFAYFYIDRAQKRAFAERIQEESEALVRFYSAEAVARLRAAIEARSISGGSLFYGLFEKDGRRLAGMIPAPGERFRPGWSEAPERGEAGTTELHPEIVRMLANRLSDGCILVVGDERTSVDILMRAIAAAFIWALLVALGVGLLGGLWLSRHFLRRLKAMHAAARAILSGDWRRRIPESTVDDDLAALARTFNRMFARIEKLLTAQRQVASDIAHDLRRPLARVLRLLEGARESHEAEAVSRAIEGVEEVLTTFEALLRIGEVESGARRAAFRPLDISEVVRDVAEAFRPSAEDEGRKLTLKLDAPIPIHGDVALLKQAFANLIDNAMRHTPPGVAIDVTATQTPNGFQIEVADHGPGVAEADRARLFERFFRADEARSSAGTGLGLALVAAIAKVHEMEVRAMNAEPGLRLISTMRAHV